MGSWKKLKAKNGSSIKIVRMPLGGIKIKTENGDTQLNQDQSKDLLIYLCTILIDNE